MAAFAFHMLTFPPSSQRRLGSSFEIYCLDVESWIPAFAGMMDLRGEL